MIKDRGNIKWTSLMLPEHTQALREWFFHVAHCEEKPILSDDQLNEMDRTIQNAIKNCCKVTVHFYDHSKKRKQKIIGMVKKIDLLRNSIEMITDDGILRRIDIHEILEVIDNA